MTQSPHLAKILAILLLPLSLSAQDAFFTHFFNGESLFNPALVGYRGSVSLGMKYKNQWNGSNGPRRAASYQSAQASFEESLPCSILDYGLQAGMDREGEGLLRTVQFGGQVAGAIPFGDSRRFAGNLRLGGGIQWGQKSIDYSRLIFSDQLDPKYGYTNADGNPLPSSFVPPNGGASLWYFAPSVGFSVRALFIRSRHRERSPTLHAGAAFHNLFALGDGDYSGNEESLLRIGTTLPKRFTAFATLELVPFSAGRDFLSLKPSVFYQRQANVDALHAGLRLGLNRIIAVGVYANVNAQPRTGVNTNWMTFTLETGQVLKKYSRVDLGLAYSANFSGLRNQVGPIFELSAVWHIGKSPVCGWINQDNDLTQDGIDCPTSSQTVWRKKMYEGIWYKTNNN